MADTPMTYRSDGSREEKLRDYLRTVARLYGSYPPPSVAGRIQEAYRLLGMTREGQFVADEPARANARAEYEAKVRAHEARWGPWESRAVARPEVGRLDTPRDARIRRELEREAEDVARRTAEAEARAANLAKARAVAAERRAARKAEREARAAERESLERDRAALEVRVRDAYEAACELRRDGVAYGEAVGVAVTPTPYTVPFFRTDRRRNGRLPHEEDGGGDGWDDAGRAVECGR